MNVGLFAQGSTRRIFAALSAVCATVGAAALVLPKSHAYADQARFWLVVAFLAAVVAGLASALGFSASWGDERTSRRHRLSSRALRDTTHYILTERRLARRYRLLLVSAGFIVGALWILGHWPQLPILQPARSALLAIGAGIGLLLAGLLLLTRHNRLNVRFLKRLLRDQERHAGWSSDTTPVYGQGKFALTFRDLSQGGAIVLGQSGGGKSWTVGSALLDQLLQPMPGTLPISGVILDPQATYFLHIEALARRYGREDDLHILSIDNWATKTRSKGAIGWNPSDTKEDAGEFAARAVAGACLAGNSRSQDTFFVDAARVYIKHAFALLRAADPETPANLLQIIELGRKPAEGPSLYEVVTNDMVRSAPPDSNFSDEINAALNYFEGDFKNMGDRQRAGLVSTVTNFLDDFSADVIREIICGPSTLTIPDLLEQGKLLYVHIPLADRPRLGRMVASLIKLELQKCVLQKRLRQKAFEDLRPSFLFIDEYQSLFLSGQGGDAEFYDRSRASRHANVLLAQNISSFLRLTENRSDVMNALGNLSVKIFLRNTEPETVKFASDLFGDRNEIAVSISQAAQSSWWRGRTSYSWSARNARVVAPEAFAELAIPVEHDPSRHFAASIIHLGSRAQTQKVEVIWPIHRLPS